MGVGSLIAGIVEGAFNSGYSIYTDQRDYWENMARYDEQIRREDNAVQRRVADLEAAGLNKNLAAGSAASSSSVNVSRGGANLGGVLDALAASSQLSMQKAQTENMKKQNLLLNEKIKEQKFINNIVSNESDISNDTTAMLRGSYDGNLDSALYKEFMWRLQNGKNSADILQKQNDWFNTEHVVDMAGNIIGDISSVSGSGNKWFDSFMKNRGSQSVTETYRRGGYSRTETYRR